MLISIKKKLKSALTGVSSVLPESLSRGVLEKAETIEHDFSDRFSGRVPVKAKRNPRWHVFRKMFLEENPTCEICGSSQNLEVHHIIPFYLRPDLELELDNLITLCDGNNNFGIKSCHLFAHKGSWKSFDENIVELAKTLKKRNLGGS